jgi:hypothetical protein
MSGTFADWRPKNLSEHGERRADGAALEILHDSAGGIGCAAVEKLLYRCGFEIQPSGDEIDRVEPVSDIRTEFQGRRRQ